MVTRDGRGSMVGGEGNLGRIMRARRTSLRFRGDGRGRDDLYRKKGKKKREETPMKRKMVVIDIETETNWAESQVYLRPTC